MSEGRAFHGAERNEQEIEPVVPHWPPDERTVHGDGTPLRLGRPTTRGLCPEVVNTSDHPKTKVVEERKACKEGRRLLAQRERGDSKLPVDWLRRVVQVTTESSGLDRRCQHPSERRILVRDPSDSTFDC